MTKHVKPVYLLLSRSGPLGALGILFTPTAMVIAQAILGIPIVIALVHRTMVGVWARYGDALLVDLVGQFLEKRAGHLLREGGRLSERLRDGVLLGPRPLRSEGLVHALVLGGELALTIQSLNGAHNEYKWPRADDPNQLDGRIVERRQWVSLRLDF